MEDELQICAQHLVDVVLRFALVQEIPPKAACSQIMPSMKLHHLPETLWAAVPGPQQPDFDAANPRNSR